MWPVYLNLAPLLSHCLQLSRVWRTIDNHPILPHSHVLRSHSPAVTVKLLLKRIAKFWPTSVHIGAYVAHFSTVIRGASSAKYYPLPHVRHLPIWNISSSIDRTRQHQPCEKCLSLTIREFSISRAACYLWTNSWVMPRSHDVTSSVPCTWSCTMLSNPDA